MLGDTFYFSFSKSILRMTRDKKYFEEKIRGIMDRLRKKWATPYIGKATSPAPALDHQTTLFEAIEHLIANDLDHAVVNKNGRVVGIVCLSKMMSEYSKFFMDVSKTTVFELMEPVYYMNYTEHKIEAAQLMIDKDVEHIAVTNQAGKFLGVACITGIVA